MCLNLKPYSHLVALIQSENHASNKGKMAGRCQNDIHLTGIGLKSKFRVSLFSETFSKNPSKMLKMKIFTFYGSFSGILSAYFVKCNKIKVVPNIKLGLVTILLNSYPSSRVSKCKKCEFSADFPFTEK